MDQQTEEQSPFERQRAQLISQVGQIMEQLITNMNQLNRNLESVLAVGKEFESVSTLWRSFHDVVALGDNQDPASSATAATAGTSAGVTTTTTGSA